MKEWINYTNRRRVEISSATPDDNIKSDSDKKLENDEEFENICSRIKECSMSEQLSQKVVKPTSASSSSSSSTSSSTGRHPAVEEFQLFLEERGGHYGGWKEKDHLFFVKLRSKFPLKKTVEMVHENFPDISTESIITHDTWYNNYQRLKTAKKKAIEEWKKTQKLSPKVKEEPKPEPKPAQTRQRDPRLKEKIEIWKAHTLATKLERLEERRKEEVRKQKLEEERKKKQEERRMLVSRYREEKLKYELAMKTATEVSKLQEKREANRQSEILLKYFRYEDRRFTERQRAVRQKPMRAEPRVKSCVEVGRDPERLLRPTQGWIQHTRRVEGETSVQMQPLYIHHVTKLGKPAWRKAVSS